MDTSTIYDITQERDAFAQVLKDIVDMKIEADNIEPDDNFEDMLEHYRQALLRGNIEMVYRYGKLMAFADWIRLPKVPKNKKFTYEDTDTEHGGLVLYIMNCCVRDDKKHKYLWRIVHMLRVKNHECHTICWHDKENGLHIYSNMKKYRR